MEKPHKKLEVWKMSMELTGLVYRIVESFPSSEQFGLASQMRRAAVSIPSNIAEGAARGSKNEWRRFLCIARGSLSELDTQLDLCRQLSLITAQHRMEADALLTRIDKMLYSLHRASQTKPLHTTL